MKLKPLDDRVVIKQSEAEETLYVILLPSLGRLISVMESRADKL